MIEGGLQNHWGRGSARTHQAHRLVDREGAGVMVWMSTLIGMRKDDLRHALQHQSFDPPDQPRQLETRLLIGNSQPLAANILQSSHGQVAAQLGLGGPPVVSHRREGARAPLLFFLPSPADYINKASGV